MLLLWDLLLRYHHEGWVPDFVMQEQKQVRQWSDTAVVDNRENISAADVLTTRLFVSLELVHDS